MNIVFSDKRIREYKNGDFHAINDGKPITAPSLLVADLLAATHILDGEPVGVFVPAQAPIEPAELGYPEGFPLAKVLEKLRFTYADTQAMTREQLIELKGIGEKGADAIIEFHKEK